MIHPHTELRFVSEHTGHGVFATRPIPRGTVVWMHDALDQVLSSDRVQGLPPALRQQVERYAHVNAAGQRVLCWDHARYMNHSCDPSTVSVGVLMEIARRDLAPGDELTCEYGLDYITAPFPCGCGAPTCRGTLVPEDAREQRVRWDRESQQVFDWALTVPQPLAEVGPAAGPAGALVQALRDRRPLRLPSWLEGTPGA